jgi:hypothetical protein
MHFSPKYLLVRHSTAHKGIPFSMHKPLILSVSLFELWNKELMGNDLNESSLMEQASE